MKLRLCDNIDLKLLYEHMINIKKSRDDLIIGYYKLELDIRVYR